MFRPMGETLIELVAGAGPAGEGELVQEAAVAGRGTVAAGRMAECAGETGLVRAGGTGDQGGLAVRDPLSGGEAETRERSRPQGAWIEVFGRGVETQWSEGGAVPFRVQQVRLHPLPPSPACGVPALRSPVGSYHLAHGAPVRGRLTRSRKRCVPPFRSCSTPPAAPLSDAPSGLFTPRQHRAFHHRLAQCLRVASPWTHTVVSPSRKTVSCPASGSIPFGHMGCVGALRARILRAGRPARNFRSRRRPRRAGCGRRYDRERRSTSSLSTKATDEVRLDDYSHE